MHAEETIKAGVSVAPSSAFIGRWAGATQGRREPPMLRRAMFTTLLSLSASLLPCVSATLRGCVGESELTPPTVASLIARLTAPTRNRSNSWRGCRIRTCPKLQQVGPLTAKRKTQLTTKHITRLNKCHLKVCHIKSREKKVYSIHSAPVITSVCLNSVMLVNNKLRKRRKPFWNFILTFRNKFSLGFHCPSDERKTVDVY